MKRIVIAGGSCGTSMAKAAEKIKKECDKRGIKVLITIHNLWETSYIDPRADMVIQTFPFFRELSCVLIDGRPFVHGRKEQELLTQIITILEKER